MNVCCEKWDILSGHLHVAWLHLSIGSKVKTCLFGEWVVNMKVLRLLASWQLTLHHPHMEAPKTLTPPLMKTVWQFCSYSHHINLLTTANPTLLFQTTDNFHVFRINRLVFCFQSNPVKQALNESVFWATHHIFFIRYTDFNIICGILAEHMNNSVAVVGLRPSACVYVTASLLSRENSGHGGLIWQ